MSLNNPDNIEEVMAKLQTYCGYQERCKKEVLQKLADLGANPDSFNLIIDRLEEGKFLNEERFAKSFARGKFRIKKWGKRRIINELKMREISEFNIKRALNEIDEVEYMLVFNKISNKRFTELKETNKYRKRKKLADYLLYRGWESDIVYKKTLELIP